MESTWLSAHAFTLLQSVGIIGGLVFTGLAFRAETRSRRVGNLIVLTQHHRDIWEDLYTRPSLSRVLKTSVDLDKAPVTREEEVFVLLLILHLNAAFRAMSDSLAPRPEVLRQDIRSFFALPIPAAAWLRYRSFQDRDFVDFVEGVLG